MKVAVVHAGYSGIALAAVLSRHNTVRLQDASARAVARINNGDCPSDCPETARILARHKAGEVDLDLKAMRGMGEACKGVDFAIVTTPPRFDAAKGTYDTTGIEKDVAAVRSANPKAWIVVRSMVPTGFTRRLAARTGDERLLFSPDMTREGTAYADTLNPSRAIVGADREDPAAVEAAQAYADLIESSCTPDRERVVTGLAEAEAIGLFTHCYRCLRGGVVNEIDTYCGKHDYDSRDVLAGVDFDAGDEPRPTIGSDGFLVPDTAKALLANYPDAPRTMVQGMVAQRDARLDWVAGEVVRQVYHQVYATGGEPLVGLFRPSDNGFNSDCGTTSVVGLIRRVGEKGIQTLVFEPHLPEGPFGDSRVTHDLDEFRRECSVIVCGRWHHDLEGVREKVYTRDLRA